MSDPEIIIKHTMTEKSFPFSKKFTVNPGEQTYGKL